MATNQNTFRLITGLSGIAFVILKLTNYIDWSWWWVTAPFWIPLTIVLGVLIILFIQLYIAVSNDNNN